MATAIGLTVVLGACGGGTETKALPNVVGKRLDIAKSDMKLAGVNENKIEVLGGGVFGVVVDSNWTVCDQDPAAGAKEGPGVRLAVDRVCDAGSGFNPTAQPASASDGGAAAASTQPTVPNMVGQDLQEAQDNMQAAGFYNLKSHDVSGQDRLQVLDRNWKVCSQTPPGGATTSKDTLVDFGVVKDAEVCPR